MIAQDITLIEGVTFIKELKTESDISGFTFSLQSNHPERNLSGDYVEVYDIDRGWVHGKALNPDGNVRINIPAHAVSNFSCLNGFKYAVTAKSADGLNQVIANGKIAYKQPVDALPEDIIHFSVTGVTDNLINKLKPIIAKEAAQYKTEEKEVTVQDVAGLNEKLKSIQEAFNQKLKEEKEKFNRLIDEIADKNNRVNSRVDTDQAAIASLGKELVKANEFINNTIQSTGKVTTVKAGHNSLVVYTDGTARLCNIVIDRDTLKAKTLHADAILDKGKDIKDIYALKNGNLNEEFKAKSFIMDGLDLSFLKTIQNQIENISRRLKELEKR